MFICLVLGQGAVYTIVACDPVACHSDNATLDSNWTFMPFPLLIAIYTMTVGLHATVLPDVVSSLEMMKFVLNHPNRFHHWKRAFMCALMRTIMVFTIEITNAFRVLGRCEVILVVIGYISFTALLEIDTFTFYSLSDGLPFKRVVTSETKPDLFNIDRTTSLKNNWAAPEV